MCVCVCVWCVMVCDGVCVWIACVCVCVCVMVSDGAYPDSAVPFQPGPPTLRHLPARPPNLQQPPCTSPTTPAQPAVEARRFTVLQDTCFNGRKQSPDQILKIQKITEDEGLAEDAENMPLPTNGQPPPL